MGEVRCAALYRVSSQKQVKHDADDVTIPLQRTAIRQFLDTYHPDWTMVAEWAEEGVSAYRNSSADRDIVRDVLGAAARKQFDVLLLFKADRLSRRSLEYPVVLAQLRRLGVTTIAVADQVGGRELETDGQYDKLLRFIEGWQAETESYNTSIRVSEAMRQKSLRGEWLGGRPPYGYRVARQANGKGALEVDPTEAATVRLIFEWYLDGTGIQALTKRLNADGVPTRHGALWQLGVVRRVLLNPLVCGRVTRGRTRRGNKANSTVYMSRADWDKNFQVTAVRPDLAIVAEDIWDRAFARLRSYNKPGSAHHRGEGTSFLLSGLLRCGTCGGPVYGRVASKKRLASGSMLRYREYACKNRRTRGPSACAGQAVYSQGKVDGAILTSVRRVLAEAIDHEQVIARAKEIAAQGLFRTRARGDDARRRIDDARRVHQAWVARLDEFFANPQASLYDEELLASKVRESRDRVETLRAAMEDVAKAENEAQAQLREFEAFLRRSTNWWRVFLGASVTEQKAILREVVDHVRLDRGGYTVFYRVNVGEHVAAVEWREASGWGAS